jgi:hypothetical protein
MVMTEPQKDWCTLSRSSPSLFDQLFVFYWRKPLLTRSTAPVICWTCLVIESLARVGVIIVLRLHYSSYIY